MVEQASGGPAQTEGAKTEFQVLHIRKAEAAGGTKRQTTNNDQQKKTP